LPVFGKLTNALLEVRTKSTQIRSLLATTPLDNCVIAYSLNPASIASAIEIKAPDPAGRLKALHKLQLHGWKIGLRFDPLIYHSGFKEDYRRFFFEVFSLLDRDMLHSVSLGTFRLPADYFRKILRDYPNERLFASPMDNEHGIQRYKDGLRQSLLNFCYTELLQYIPSDKLFPCEPLN
jgi:spore photoproduct lyase